MTPKNSAKWHETIIQTVDHNRREDAVLQTREGNALTMSGQRAYQVTSVKLLWLVITSGKWYVGSHFV